MAPPEKIFLALSLLYRGDTYYANLLLDTPEAGLLDLADMSKKSAEDWLLSFRELMTGIDPMKIPVLYEHEKPANYINFGRPPTEMMFAETTGKYSRITHAGYGLTETDTGLGDPQKTLAGSIRDERRSRRSGFSTVREKAKGLINSEILPPYLEFNWMEKDEEGQVQRGRAFLLAAQGLAKAKEAGFISEQEGQAQLVKDGHITVAVEEPEEIEPPPFPPALPPPSNGNQDELGKVPAEQGGRGDITGRAELGDENIAAVPAGSAKFDQLAQVIREQFAGVLNRMEQPRLMKLIKAATRLMFPDVAQAFIELSETELPLWKDERLKLWFGERSAFDDLPDVVKRIEDEVLDALDDILTGDDWWKIDAKAADSIALVLRLAFEEGATGAAEVLQEFLYTEGLRDSPSIIGLNFNLSNPRTLAQLETKAAQLVTRVDDGTRFFLRRIITAGVDEGLASPSIAELIREGADAEAILKEAGYTSRVVDTVRAEVGNMTENRVASIVNTEINKAESMGRLEQWTEQGLTQKRWAHTGVFGPGDPCPICQANIDLGLVPMDFEFTDVFGATQTPPGHPGTCHCSLEFDEEELVSKADTLTIWTGE
jgi:hypothetical protein